MAKTFTCLCCRRMLPANPRVKNQKYCGRADCQRARKRKWQRVKMDTDPDYRLNQRDAQRDWTARNLDYWRKRRQASRRKDAGRQPNKAAGTPREPVKMDASTANFIDSTVEYMLMPVDVKMDALRVKIAVVSMA